MAQLSVDGGSNYYGAYDVDLVADDVYRKWDEIECQMDPGILNRAEEEYGNRGLLALLEQYLLYAWDDMWCKEKGAVLGALPSLSDHR